MENFNKVIQWSPQRREEEETNKIFYKIMGKSFPILQKKKTVNTKIQEVH